MKVTMINSVGEHVAGEEYDLEPDLADRFIALGYADGKLSRNFSDEELQGLRANTQEVSV